MQVIENNEELRLIGVQREQEADLIAQQTQVVNTVGQLHSDVSSLQVVEGPSKDPSDYDSG